MDKKNVIAWVSHYEVTDYCCSKMSYALQHKHLEVRASHPGTSEPSIAIAGGSSWYGFKHCPWCGAEF